MEIENVKWTRGGHEILNAGNGVKIITHHAVIALATVSLKTILNMFPSEIYTIKARTKVDETVNNLLLQEVGAKIVQSTSKHFILNNRNRDANLWHEWVAKLIEFMKENEIKDAPVQNMSIRVHDEKLLQIAQENGYLTHVKKADFLMEFNSVLCEGDSDKARLLEHKVNSNLIQNHGFKYDMLHCNKVFSVEDVHSVPKERRTPIVDWRTAGIKNYFSPIMIAKQIKVHLKDFGCLKTYKPGEFKRLILDRCW